MDTWGNKLGLPVRVPTSQQRCINPLSHSYKVHPLVLFLFCISCLIKSAVWYVNFDLLFCCLWACGWVGGKILVHSHYCASCAVIWWLCCYQFLPVLWMKLCQNHSNTETHKTNTRTFYKLDTFVSVILCSFPGV